MIRFVNAKINLGLNIIGRRPDGYHNLNTVFYPVGIYNGTPENPEPFNDIIEIHIRPEREEDEFIFSGNPIDCPSERNLVCKAVGSFRESIVNQGLSLPPVSLWLDKHIPDGAGLGGGSADASFTLMMLNELTGFTFTKDQLKKMAAKLGADCPFFIENVPVFAEGIGDIMSPVKLNLSGFWTLIIKPDIYVSTKEAFEGIMPSLPEKSIKEILVHPVEEWCERGLKNDFEEGLFKLHPRLRELKESLYDSGALYASMSGSGSSLFGIFSSREAAYSAFVSFRTLPSLSSYLCKL